MDLLIASVKAWITYTYTTIEINKHIGFTDHRVIHAVIQLTEYKMTQKGVLDDVTEVTIKKQLDEGDQK